MPFAFSLQEVLEYRIRVEEIRQREFAEAQRQVEYVQGLIDRARQTRLDYQTELNEMAIKGTEYAWQELHANYIKGLGNLIAKSEDHLAQLRREMERRRSFLMQAVKDRQVMDELKKQEYRQYLIDEKRLEMKVFDEIAVRNFLMSSREKNAESVEELG